MTPDTAMRDREREELRRLCDSAEAFLKHFNPWELAEGKSQQWFAVYDQIKFSRAALAEPSPEGPAATLLPDAERVELVRRGLEAAIEATPTLDGEYTWEAALKAKAAAIRAIDPAALVGALASPKPNLDDVLKAVEPFIAFWMSYGRPRQSIKAEDTIITSTKEAQITLADFDRLVQATSIEMPLIGDSRRPKPMYPDDGGLKEPTRRLEDTTSLQGVVRRHFGIDPPLPEQPAPASPWRDISTAKQERYHRIRAYVPEFGEMILAWGKASHVPLYGWINPFGGDPENTEILHPTHWQPLDRPPADAGEEGPMSITDRKVLVIDWDDLSALEEALIRSIQRVDEAIDNTNSKTRATKLRNERGALHGLLKMLTDAGEEEP